MITNTIRLIKGYNKAYVHAKSKSLTRSLVWQKIMQK